MSKFENLKHYKAKLEVAGYLEEKVYPWTNNFIKIRRM